jgi:hypothetical protein
MRERRSLYNRQFKNKYLFFTIKIKSKNFKKDEMKNLLLREINKILQKNQNEEKLCEIVEFPSEEFIIYIISKFEGKRSWKDLLENICSKNNISLESFSNLTINPF